eukprot:1138226-Amorphochlora_amoeboformis.AAC.2
MKLVGQGEQLITYVLIGIVKYLNLNLFNRPDRETTVVIRSITPSGFARVNGDSDGEIDLSIVSEFEECTLFKSPKRILNKENVYFNFQTTEGTMYLRVKRERGEQKLT